MAKRTLSGIVKHVFLDDKAQDNLELSEGWPRRLFEPYFHETLNDNRWCETLGLAREVCIDITNDRLFNHHPESIPVLIDWLNTVGCFEPRDVPLGLKQCNSVWMRMKALDQHDAQHEDDDFRAFDERTQLRTRAMKLYTVLALISVIVYKTNESEALEDAAYGACQRLMQEERASVVQLFYDIPTNGSDIDLDSPLLLHFLLSGAGFKVASNLEFNITGLAMWNLFTKPLRHGSCVQREWSNETVGNVSLHVSIQDDERHTIQHINPQEIFTQTNSWLQWIGRGSGVRTVCFDTFELEDYIPNEHIVTLDPLSYSTLQLCTLDIRVHKPLSRCVAEAFLCTADCTIETLTIRLSTDCIMWLAGVLTRNPSLLALRVIGSDGVKSANGIRNLFTAIRMHPKLRDVCLWLSANLDVSTDDAIANEEWTLLAAKLNTFNVLTTTAKAAEQVGRIANAGLVERLSVYVMATHLDASAQALQRQGQGHGESTVRHHRLRHLDVRVINNNGEFYSAQIAPWLWPLRNLETLRIVGAGHAVCTSVWRSISEGAAPNLTTVCMYDEWYERRVGPCECRHLVHKALSNHVCCPHLSRLVIADCIDETVDDKERVLLVSSGHPHWYSDRNNRIVTRWGRQAALWSAVAVGISITRAEPFWFPLWRGVVKPLVHHISRLNSGTVEFKYDFSDLDDGSDPFSYTRKERAQLNWSVPLVHMV